MHPFSLKDPTMDPYVDQNTKKKVKNDKINTGVSGVSGDSPCNRPACPQLA
jgi:hypothetical protein